MKAVALTVVAVVVLVLVAVLLLGVKALFVKGGRFPSGHVHDLPRRQRLARERLRVSKASRASKQDKINKNHIDKISQS